LELPYNGANTKDSRMTFGDKLKELRQAKGMSQSALADMSGVPVGTIRDYEQGRRDPLLSNAQKLAAALNAPLDSFPAVKVTRASAAGKKPASKKK
jgi:transcriptional regulator with XRE-family HTH domain